MIFEWTDSDGDSGRVIPRDELADYDERFLEGGAMPEVFAAIHVEDGSSDASVYLTRGQADALRRTLSQLLDEGVAL